MIHAVIPAHNEMERIAACIRSLQAQTHKIDKITVVCDNCSDETPIIAHEMGAEVFCTKDNRNKKAGALNAYLSTLFEEENRKIFVVDADSEVSPRFVEEAMKHPDAAVGGIFLEDGKNGLLGRMQGAEYVRYAREVARAKAHTKVLSGTSTITSLSWLINIAGLRGTLLPGEKGEVYNTASIVEDFDLTLSLKKLGIETISPRECLVITETMPTIKELWKQRIRWQRGTFETIMAFGINRITVPYYFSQGFRLLGLVMMVFLWFLMVMLLAAGYFEINYMWMSLGLIFYIERIVGVWRGSKAHKWIASAFVFDLMYDLFTASVNLYVWYEILTKKKHKWGISTIDNV